MSKQDNTKQNASEDLGFLASSQFQKAQETLQRDQLRRRFMHENLPRFGERFLQKGDFSYEYNDGGGPIEELDIDDLLGEDPDVPGVMDQDEYHHYLKQIGVGLPEQTEHAIAAKEELQRTFGGDTEHLYRYEDIDRGLQLKRAVLDGYLSFNEAQEIYCMLGSYIDTDLEMLMWPISGIEGYEEIAGDFADQFRVGDGGDYGPPPVWTGAIYWGDSEYQRIRQFLHKQTWSNVHTGHTANELDPEEAQEENFHCTHTVGMGVLFGLGALFALRMLQPSSPFAMRDPKFSLYTRLHPMYRMRYPHVGSTDGITSPAIMSKLPFTFRQYGKFRVPFPSRYTRLFPEVDFSIGPVAEKAMPFPGVFRPRDINPAMPKTARLGGLGIVFFFGLMGLMECFGQFGE